MMNSTGPVLSKVTVTWFLLTLVTRPAVMFSRCQLPSASRVMTNSRSSTGTVSRKVTVTRWGSGASWPFST